MPYAAPVVLIREERPSDHAAVGALITAAFTPMSFSDGTEAALPGALRAAGAAAVALSLRRGSIWSWAKPSSPLPPSAALHPPGTPLGLSRSPRGFSALASAASSSGKGCTAFVRWGPRAASSWAIPATTRASASRRLRHSRHLRRLRSTSWRYHSALPCRPLPSASIQPLGQATTLRRARALI